VDQEQDHESAEPDQAEVAQSEVIDDDSVSGAIDLGADDSSADEEATEEEATEEEATEEEATEEEAAGEGAQEGSQDEAHHDHPQSRAGIIIDELRRLERRAVHLPLVGKLHAPDKHDVIYAAGMTALIAFGIVELPIALAVLGGHALVKQHHSRSLSAIGEVMEDFWVR
jgi:hypothetical protein